MDNMFHVRRTEPWPTDLMDDEEKNNNKWSKIIALLSFFLCLNQISR